MNGLETHLLLLQIVIVAVAVIMYYVLRKGPGRSTNRTLATVIGVITVCVMVVSAITYKYYVRNAKYEINYEDVAAVYLNGIQIDDPEVQKNIVDQFNGIEDAVRNSDGSDTESEEHWLIVELKNGNRIKVLDLGEGEVQVQLGFPELSKYDCYYSGEQKYLSELINH